MTNALHLESYREALVFLGTAGVVVPLFHRLRISPVLGFLIAGAALDVFWDEPVVDPELRRLPNVVLTPHIASATVETRQAMAALTMDNLRAFYNKQSLPTLVPECQT